MPVNDVLQQVSDTSKPSPPQTPTDDNAPDEPAGKKEIPRERPMDTPVGLPPYVHSRDLRVDKETALDVVAAVSSVAGLL